MRTMGYGLLFCGSQTKNNTLSVIVYCKKRMIRYNIFKEKGKRAVT